MLLLVVLSWKQKNAYYDYLAAQAQNAAAPVGSASMAKSQKPLTESSMAKTKPSMDAKAALVAQARSGGATKAPALPVKVAKSGAGTSARPSAHGSTSSSHEGAASAAGAAGAGTGAKFKKASGPTAEQRKQLLANAMGGRGSSNAARSSAAPKSRASGQASARKGR